MDNLNTQSTHNNPEFTSQNLPDQPAPKIKSRSNSSTCNEKNKTELSVVDESTPRFCDYLGSFEVKNFVSPEDRGNYITKQLYVICKQREDRNRLPSESPSEKSEASQDSSSKCSNQNIQKTQNPAQKSWPVCLVLTIAGIKVCDPSNLKNVLQMFALRRISFSTAIPALSVFAISAREPGSPHNLQYAHVFKTNNAEEINQIVGLAFKQAYTLEKPTNSCEGEGLNAASPTPMSQISDNLQKLEDQKREKKKRQTSKEKERPTLQIQRSKSNLASNELKSSEIAPQPKSFEQRIFSQIFKKAADTPNLNTAAGKSADRALSTNSSSSKTSSSSQFGFFRRSKSFKKPSPVSRSGHVKDASLEFQVASSSKSTVSSKSSVSAHGSKIPFSGKSSKSGITSSLSCYESASSVSVTSASEISQSKPNMPTPTQEDLSTISPQSQWHQPSLHPDTARDLLINLPLGSFFVVGSRSPLNLIIRGERSIYQFNIAANISGGYFLILNSQLKKCFSQQAGLVFENLVNLIYYYSTIVEGPLPCKLYHGYFKRIGE